jgi:hypothetical protein
MQPKNFFPDRIKNSWNAGIGMLKSKGIMMKSNTNFVSVCLQQMCFFWKVPLLFDIPP